MPTRKVLIWLLITMVTCTTGSLTIGGAVWPARVLAAGEAPAPAPGQVPPEPKDGRGGGPATDGQGAVDGKPVDSKPGAGKPADGSKGASAAVKITGVNFRLSKGRPHISIHADQPARFKAYLLTLPDRVVVDLFDARLAIPQGPIPVDDPIVKQIRVSQFKPDLARVVVDLKRSTGYQIAPAPGDPKHIDLFLNYQVNGVEFARKDGMAQLTVNSTSKITYDVNELLNPLRLVVDIANATLAAPAGAVAQNDQDVKQVRTSQFDAGSVRVVLDLNASLGYREASSPEDPTRLVLKLAPEVLGATLERTAAGLQLRVATTSARQYKVEHLADPERLVLDIPQTFLATTTKGVAVEDPNVKKISLEQLDNDTVRVTVELAGYFGHTAGLASNNRGIDLWLKDSALKGRRIAIDAGHGGSDPGSMGSNGAMEKEITLDIAKKIQAILQQRGATVVMTRTDDSFVPLDARADQANAARTEVFVSVHTNSFRRDSTNGVETYYYGGRRESFRLAQEIQRFMLEASGLADRWVKATRDLVVVRDTKMPAVLAEVAFISNPEEEKLLQDPSFRQKAALAIANGLEAYFAEKPAANAGGVEGKTGEALTREVAAIW
ncbi:MAG: N-acetylmuramoyl-L-alanine amidase [Firmicutes bacterium]|nr:N-acetylmuramoyl-L-alanine amidase [Bacillota bacterium]